MYNLFIYTNTSYQRGDCMKVVKPMMLMAMGAGAVIAYQKYSKSVMDKMSDDVEDIKKKACKKLDSMMK